MTDHPHDLPPEDSDMALAAADRPELLLELMRLSRGAFNFFTRHFPHTINYPWAASRLQSLPAGSRALDIGAGLSPLPLFLARRGIHVDTVDRSELLRVLPPKDDWNEWGYFDYQLLDPRVRSFNYNILDFTPEHRYDAVVSICALAHMVATEREATLRKCELWLKPGSVLLLAIDLLPSTDYVWNIAGADELEPRERHGKIGDVRRQLDDLGLPVTELVIRRNVPKSRTDLAFIECRR